jgi:hypothetical protein
VVKGEEIPTRWATFMGKTRQQRRARERRGEQRPLRVPKGFRAYYFAVGTPLALVAIGMTLAMVGVSYFWLGIGAASCGLAWLLVDWIVYSSEMPLPRRVLGAIPILAVSFFVVWVSIRPAPLDISACVMDGDYPVGIEIAGIKWNNSFADVRVDIVDGSKEPYYNLHAFFRTNILIAKIGTKSKFSPCIVAPVLPITVQSLQIKDWNRNNTIPNPDESASILMAPVFQIYCEKIVPTDQVEIVMAVSAFDGRRSIRVKPSWVSGAITYDGLSHSRTMILSKCFDTSCKDIPPPLPLDGLYLTKFPPLKSVE